MKAELRKTYYDRHNTFITNKYILPKNQVKLGCMMRFNADLVVKSYWGIQDNYGDKL